MKEQKLMYLKSIDWRIDEDCNWCWVVFDNIKTSLFRKKEIPQEPRVQIFNKVVTPIMKYTSKTWTSMKKERNKTEATEVRFLMKIDTKTKLEKT